MLRFQLFLSCSVKPVKKKKEEMMRELLCRITSILQNYFRRAKSMLDIAAVACHVPSCSDLVFYLCPIFQDRE